MKKKVVRKVTSKKPAKRKAQKNTAGNALSADHKSALRAFARAHGRNWRSILFERRARGSYGLPADVVHAFNVAGQAKIRAFKP